MAAEPFDIGQFWNGLTTMMTFVKGRLEFGQNDSEEAKMHAYLESAYTSLKAAIIVKGQVESTSEHASRIFFWADCKRHFEQIYDIKAKKPKSSIRFDSFYKCLFQLQELAMGKPESFWITNKKPSERAFPESLSRARSRSPHRRGKEASASAVGKQGIWLWKNPPELLHDGKGFWIFFKHAYWVCDTPEDPSELDRFEVVTKQSGRPRVDGNFTLWVREKYASSFPFLYKYEKSKGINYGLLQRLDRETSGPVLVGKNEDGWSALKDTRDNHDWHKEYLCLVHGKIPPSSAQGVICEWILSEASTAFGQRSAKSRIVAGPGVKGKGNERPKQGVTVYEVLEHFTGSKADYHGKSPKYTLVKIRIITGLRHQIRVHMHHLLESFGDVLEAGDAYGLVSDFLYLDRSTSDWDQKHVCERVFLHERCLGMWDPEDSNATQMIWACPETLPQELQSCLDKLIPDAAANKALKDYQNHLAKKSELEAFCQKYGISALEKQKLQEPTWDDWRATFMKSFRQRAGDELPKMSMPPARPGMPRDHSFLVSGLIQQMLTVGDDDAVEEVLEREITQKVYDQNRQSSLESIKEARANEPLPPGWRRMVAPDGAFLYMHVSGQVEKRKPLPDPDLPEGWTKFEREGRVGQFVYYHAKDRNTIFHRPTNYELPPGWIKMTSKSEKGKEYYLHKGTGTTQLGPPCPGPPEDLPGEWEKVAKRSELGAFYYYNRATGKFSNTRPEGDAPDAGKSALPEGWTEETSSKGQKYYFHKASNTSQFERPASQDLPSGWTIMTSSKGQKYYFHKASGKSQYDRPKAK
eukprot:TRINITY_DN15153_c0_g1_i1.p1 TRINITY_DN15153_c0_g1~~TRINITY_DN15153_c0_g1_i1.p1  ORF type:complete len:809 (+),score=143.47 TRINITY_DN15153_c0_g1_i1:91-2517(+)